MRRGDDVDALLAVQQARDVGVVEQPLGAGQPERGAGDDHRLARPRAPPSPGAPISSRPRSRNSAKQAPELAVRRVVAPAHGRGAAAAAGGGVAARPPRRGAAARRARAQRGGLARGRLDARAQPGGPQAAQRAG